MGGGWGVGANGDEIEACSQGKEGGEGNEPTHVARPVGADVDRRQGIGSESHRHGDQNAEERSPGDRSIQRLVQNPLAIQVLEGEFAEGETVVVEREPGSNRLSFRSADAPAAAGT